MPSRAHPAKSRRGEKRQPWGGDPPLASFVIPSWIRDPVAQGSPNHSKVQERSALCIARLGPCGVLDAPGTPRRGCIGKPGSDRFIHQMKEPDEG
jgi:hypothetical protein